MYDMKIYNLEVYYIYAKHLSQSLKHVKYSWKIS